MKKLLIALIAVTSAVCGQTRFRDFSELASYAEKNSFEIKSASLKKLEAKKKNLAAKGTLLPQASLSASIIDNLERQTSYIPAEIFGGPKGSYVEAQFGQKYNNSAVINASVDLLNLESWNSISQSGLSRLVAEKNEELVSKNLKETLAQVYYQTLIYKDVMAAAKNCIEKQDSILIRAENKLTEGASALIDYNKVKINNNNAHEIYNQSESYYAIGLRNLKTLAGIPESEEIILDETLSSLFAAASQEYDSSDLTYYPETEISELQMRLAGKEYWRSIYMFVPKISFIGSFGYQQNSAELSPFGGPDWKNSSYIGLKLELPLFTGFSRYNSLSGAKAGYEVSKAEYEYQSAKTEVGKQNLMDDYNRSYESMRSSYETQSLSAKNTEILENRYDEGVAGVEQYSTALNDYINFFNQYLTKAADYYANRIKIEETIKK